MNELRTRKGIVTRGINNIFTVLSDQEIFECRLKGKQLADTEDEYNPLAVGDRVEFISHAPGQAMITARLQRDNWFQRWNAKRERNQTVVANMDKIYCICSVESPPFRPRFIDRVIACASFVEVGIILNKSDILLTEEEHERFSLYSELGYETLAVSAKTGEHIDELKALLKGKTVAFVGQSGVGKSSLINTLLNLDDAQKTGQVSEKYNRGRHTTNYSLMLNGPDFSLVDTPGVRELLIPDEDPAVIAHTFPEFRPALGACQFDGCQHDREPGCKVKRLVEAGDIHPDRYESYLRMLESLRERAPFWETGSKKD